MQAYEVNFDGLPGPTHNYAGLAYGNLASVDNALTAANPKAAVQQGIAKMRVLLNHGIKQALIPPQARPNLPLLRQLGFAGNIEKILRDTYQHQPRLLAASYSAASMWTANAATVSPSADTADGRVHFTAANLNSNFHRHQEAIATSNFLKVIFADDHYFCHHHPLPPTLQFGDEGAANHTRLCSDYAAAGVEFLVFGKYAFAGDQQFAPQQFPARQTYEACAAIARLHGLNPAKTVISQQNPAVIDQGVFHNDLIAVGNQQVLFYHQQAFLNSPQVITELQQKAAGELHFIEVNDEVVSVADAVSSYLFNSQLVTLSNNSMLLIAPIECQQHPTVKRYLENLILQDKFVQNIEYIDCRQSMRNGGGPACLRLRVVLTEVELQQMHQGVLVSEPLLQQLTHWSEKHYRDRLILSDLLDPQLVEESHTALDELTKILSLGSMYYFQSAGCS